jgi:hypothetical protein
MIMIETLCESKEEQKQTPTDKDCNELQTKYSFIESSENSNNESNEENNKGYTHLIKDK